MFESTIKITFFSRVLEGGMPGSLQAPADPGALQQLLARVQQLAQTLHQPLVGLSS